MTDFSHLDEYSPDKDLTKEYPLTELAGKYVLIVKQANDSNKQYQSEMLRRSGEGRGQRRKKIKVDAEFLNNLRDGDREIYPKYVVVGWKGVLDSEGEEVEFSSKGCSEFLEVLPNWIFDPLREFCTDPQNFMVVIDSEELGKN